MLDILLIFAGGFIAIYAWRFSIIIGFIVSLLVFGILLYRRSAALCMGVAMRQYTLGKKNKAMDWFEKGYKFGMNTDQKITYSYYLLREGRVIRCEEILNSMLSFRSQKPTDRSKAKLNHAMLLMKTGRVYEAVEELEEIFPTYKTSGLYGTLGFCYLVQGNIKKALEFNEEAYDYNGDDAIITDNLMQTYAKLDRFDDAYDLSKKLMDKKPAFREAYYDTAVVEYQLGKKEDALSRLEHALTIPTSFMTTVSDDVINNLKEKIERGDAPEGSSMVFLEAKSAELPDTPTLRNRPVSFANGHISSSAAIEADEPISFNSKAADGEEMIETAAEPFEPETDDDDDGIFL